MNRLYAFDQYPEGWFSGDFKPIWDYVLNHEGNVLLTDGNGSYGLFQPLLATLCEGHVFIAPEARNRSVEIAQEMIEYASKIMSQTDLMAKTPTDNRKTQLFLRRLGFAYISSEEGFAYFMRKMR